MNYRKVIKNKKIRLFILKFFKFVPDKIMIMIQYYLQTGKKLNIRNPKTYNEKIQWYKLYHRDDRMTICADKIKVREYVISKKLNEILIPIYGTYYSISELNINSLPKSFVLKANNDSGSNIIVKDIKFHNTKKIKRKAKEWLKFGGVSYGREWAYYGIKPGIICEKYLDDPNSELGLLDYKFFCFRGRPQVVQVDFLRETNHKRNIYDLNWSLIDSRITYENYCGEVKKPANFDRMIEIASILSRDFPHARVDLYNINGKIYFGEITFYHGSGYEKFYPEEFGNVMGEFWKLEREIIK